MNLIIITDSETPDSGPLVFIAPDTVTGDALTDQYPGEMDGYRVETLYGDQVDVIGDLDDILATLSR